MAWGRIEDEFAFHPKIVAAGNAAVGAFVRMIAYCNRYLTDGFVEESTAKIIANEDEAKVLLQRGLLEPAEGGYRIHDFHSYNPTAEEVRSAQSDLASIRSSAGKRGGIASGIARRREAKPKQTRSKTEANDQANAKQKGSPVPDPEEESLPRARNGSEPYSAKRFHDTWYATAKKTPSGDFQKLVVAAEMCEKSAALFAAVDVEQHAESLIGAFIRLIRGWKDNGTLRPQLRVESFVTNFAACEEVLTGERDPREAMRVNGHAKQPNASAAAVIAAMAREVAGDI